MRNKTDKTDKTNIYQITMIGIAAAITCIMAPLSIPIGPVPISLTHLAIYFSLYALGMKKGFISYLVYMLIGMVGLPVFSNFTGGFAKIMGPTGGYIIGFAFMALVSGFFIDRFFEKRLICFLGIVAGNIICYALGSLWLAYQANITFSLALAEGVIPFIPFDFVKILIGIFLGPQIRQRLIKAHLFKA